MNKIINKLTSLKDSLAFLKHVILLRIFQIILEQFRSREYFAQIFKAFFPEIFKEWYFIIVSTYVALLLHHKLRSGRVVVLDLQRLGNIF